MSKENDPLDLVKTQSRDAVKWAKSFTETCKDFTKEEILDESYLIVWFANAMMAMHDSLYNNEFKSTTDQNTLLNTTAKYYADQSNWVQLSANGMVDNYAIEKDDQSFEMKKGICGGKRARLAVNEIERINKGK